MSYQDNSHALCFGFYFMFNRSNAENHQYGQIKKNSPFSLGIPSDILIEFYPTADFEPT